MLSIQLQNPEDELSKTQAPLFWQKVVLQKSCAWVVSVVGK